MMLKWKVIMMIISNDDGKDDSDCSNEDNDNDAGNYSQGEGNDC